MGAAGRERVRLAFDWPVIAAQYQTVLDELAEIRGRAANPVTRHPLDPVRGDPFAEFAHFATEAMSPETRLHARPGATGADVLNITGALDTGFGSLRATQGECAQALDLLADGRALTVRELLLAFPQPRRHAVELGLAWMAKLGLVDWLA